MFSLQQLTLRKIIVLLTLTASIMILSLPNLPWPGSEQDLGDSGLPRHAEQCVPFYDLISRESSKEEKEPTDSWKFPGSASTKFSPLAAYTFPTYSAITFENYGRMCKKVYCWYKDDQQRLLGRPVESIAYPLFIVYCCKHPRARYIGVSADEKSSSGIAFEEVIVRTENGTKYTLSHCLAPLRGDGTSWLLLTELIEHYLLYGVQHFYVYVQSIDPYSRRVLDDYVSSGEVEAIFLKQHWSNEDVYWMHISTIQDCIVRGRHHSSYVIMNDLDERIVPGNANESLVSLLLSTMERHKNVGLINFWSRFVFRTADLPSTYKGEKTLREHLPTLVFDNTTLTKAQRYHKCIVNTLRTFDMRIHRANAFFGNYTEVYVPMSTGYVRHYRNPSLGDFRTIILPIVEASGTFETIKYPEHLMGQLFQNIQRRLDCVYKKDLVINSTQPNC
ncbi:hypothetical protein Q1695_002190 [Nippostrongylus brasiliensis]|nr:hypothetical protein Q1695_002190 [Nippostrongylus brasiliensis]